MSFSQFPWENRVFRIDRECYLLFLGIDELDDKPFIRIGNSSWLDERVLDVISHTVITESFTGNPFGEVGLTHHYRGRYLGEPRIVEVIKSFFDRFHVSDPDVISYSEQEEREGRDHVYFYNTGNISVSFGGQRIFDLYAREKADRHYNYYCSEILTTFRKNPLKWDGGSIRGKGLFRVGESLFFFDSGRLLGLKWDRNYFKTLARAGWDPDKLEGILVNLKPEEMEGDKSAGVMNFIKRGIAAKNPMTFFSRDGSFSGKIEPLFEYVRSREVPIRFQDISSQGQFEWNETPGEWNDGVYTFHIADQVKATLSSSGKADILFGKLRADCLLPDRVPAIIHPEELSPEKLKNLYIDSVGQAILKFEPAGKEAALVRTALPVVQALFESAGSESAQLTPPQEKGAGEWKRMLRGLSGDEEDTLVLFSFNCATLLEILSREGGSLAGVSGEIAALIGKKIKVPGEQAEDFLYSVHYYDQGCFYLPYKLDISPGDRAKAAEMHEAMLLCDRREVDFFFSERKRLEEILRALSEGTLWEEIRSAESRTLAEKTSPPATATAAPSPPSSGSAAASPAAVPSGSPARAGAVGRGSGKSRRLWPLLLLLILLAGAGLFAGYDYFFRGGDSLIRMTLAGGGDNPSVTSSQRDGNSPGQGGSGDTPEGVIEGSNGGSGSDSGVVPTGSDSEGTGVEKAGSGEGSLTGDNGAGTDRIVPDSSPLSDKDSVIIPSEDGSMAPQVVLSETEDTLVRKPFTPSETFLENFIVGGIRITMADIHLKANAIAVMNGYRDLGFHKVEGKDPTIIEPGLVLKIPGNLTYRVVKDDNIWYIGARLLESELIQYTGEFEKLKAVYEREMQAGGKGDNAVKEMERLIESSNCENFRKEVKNWLNTR